MTRPGGPSADASAPVVVAARRTWVGSRYRGHLGTGASSLAAPVLRAALADVPGAAPDVDDVILGSSAGPGGNVARVAALEAGLGVGAPGLTVDRQCASGLAAVLLAGQAVRDGARAVLAGGVESPSTAPVRAHRTADGPVPFDRAAFTPPGTPDPDMGPAADALAVARHVSRERQDAYAVRSHARARAAHEAGRFAAESVAVPRRAGGTLDRDEHVRSLDAVLAARLRPAFGAHGTVTAASAAPVSDGATALVVVPEQVRAALGMPGLRLVRGAVRGSDPLLPGIAPLGAVRAVLDPPRAAPHDAARGRVAVDDLVSVEVVEAFAAQVLALTDALGLDPLGAHDGVVCPDGGTLALGHAWGSSGALSVVRLFSTLVRGAAEPGALGLAAVAAGGGLGVAALFEVVR